MSGDGLQADLDELSALAVRLRTLMGGLGGSAPASGPTWQATAAAADDVHASLDAAAQALGARIGDTAGGVDGAAAKLASNEGISSDMVSSLGDAVTSASKPGAEFAGAVTKTFGDITGALTGAVADVVGSSTAAVSAPLASLAGVLDFAALADVSNGDNGGFFDDLIGDPDQESLASQTGGDPATGQGEPATGQVV